MRTKLVRSSKNGRLRPTPRTQSRPKSSLLPIPNVHFRSNPALPRLNALVVDDSSSREGFLRDRLLQEIGKLWDFVDLPQEQRACFLHNFVLFPSPATRPCSQLKLPPVGGHPRISVSSGPSRSRGGDGEIPCARKKDEESDLDPLKRELDLLRRVKRCHDRVLLFIGDREAMIQKLQKSSSVEKRRIQARDRSKRAESKSDDDVDSVSAASTILRRVRLLTSDVVLAIVAWRKCFTCLHARNSRGEKVRISLPFFWNGEDYLQKIQQDMAFFAKSRFGVRVNRLLRLRSRIESTLYSPKAREKALRAQKIMMREIRQSGLSREQERKRKLLISSASRSSLATCLNCHWQDLFRRQAMAARVIQRACRSFRERGRLRSRQDHVVTSKQPCHETERDRRLMKRFLCRRKRRRKKRKKGRRKKKPHRRKTSRKRRRKLKNVRAKSAFSVLDDDEAMRKNAAALKIQAFFRGIVARRCVRQRRELVEDQIEKEILLEKEVLAGMLQTRADDEDSDFEANRGWLGNSALMFENLDPCDQDERDCQESVED